jgi:hypothetical protein
MTARTGELRQDNRGRATVNVGIADYPAVGQSGAENKKKNETGLVRYGNKMAQSGMPTPATVSSIHGQLRPLPTLLDCFCSNII